MSETDVNLHCRNPDCDVADTRACAEGHEPIGACPNFGDDVADVDRGASEPSSEDVVSDRGAVALPSGDALTPDDVDRFLLWRPATFITIVGDSFSGKTTLLCALYDRFLRGPFAGLSFAGSRTLIALEQRSHFARADSGRSTPDTPRTSISDGLRYYHFAAAPTQAPHRRTDLMLSDRAGEAYRNARDNTDLVADLAELGRSDRVVLLLDGARVADAVERAGALSFVRQTLRAFLDNGGLTGSAIVQVVTTKQDLWMAGDDGLVRIMTNFRDRLSRDFGPKLRELSFWDICARDPSCGLEPASGVDALLRDWAEIRPPIASAPPPPPVLTSEFDRLLSRTPMDGLP